jgi:hypothetical protein
MLNARSVVLAALTTMAVAICVGAQSGLSFAQSATGTPRTDAFVESMDHPAVAYTTGPVRNAAADLNEQVRRGTVKLSFDPATGYLRSLLNALHIPIDSQTLVFSQGSMQASQISPTNPRAVYFNDTVALGWVRGADLLEIAAQDARQGVVFYTLRQNAVSSPRLERDDRCLECHLTWDTLGVPGLQVLSTFQMSDDPSAYASGLVSDHRTPLRDRWGGWYVTGRPGTAQHRGNVPVIVKAQELQKPPRPAPQLSSVGRQFDTTGFPSDQSDVVALMVLEHQSRMTNLLTRVGWETRVAAPPPAVALQRSTGPSRLPARVLDAVVDLVDYLLFVDEPPLAAPVAGSSGFTRRFSEMGPNDPHGRSLRQLDLGRRLFRYPCSYMIYAPAFDALPTQAKEAIYERLWAILSGAERGREYARLSLGDRQAIVEILRATKPDLPPFFAGSISAK